ncbi:hypothetical protein [Arthrobacter sp. OAP107]|uniref:hypothetical protein n=1 Tax=Arthrobacter sp. OAP107 TaxID=3156445 RepID=UPI0033934A01
MTPAKHHAFYAAGLIAILIVVNILFTISSAETKETWVCLGSPFECLTTEVSGLGSICGFAGVVLVLFGLAWVFAWVTTKPR